MTSTEQKIKDAAFKIFADKGYAQTKTRDIANSARVNISTLHYYFRSKDKLFKVVSDEVFGKFSGIVETIFDADIPFQEKIRGFVTVYTDFCKDYPSIPSFIVFESERNPEKVYGKIDFKKFDRKVELQLKACISKGEIRPISYPNFILNLVALTIFPFLNKHMLYTVNGLSDKDFDELLEIRKVMVPRMIINDLYVNQTES